MSPGSVPDSTFSVALAAGSLFSAASTIASGTEDSIALAGRGACCSFPPSSGLSESIGFAGTGLTGGALALSPAPGRGAGRGGMLARPVGRTLGAVAVSFGETLSCALGASFDGVGNLRAGAGDGVPVWAFSPETVAGGGVRDGVSGRCGVGGLGTPC
jgi:hypothetical protein